jgi:SAM-dependent methyltransferase
MKYYEEHEIGYQQLKAKGLVGWDKQATLEQLLAFPYREHLLKHLPKTPATALDLGCGTGPIALTLAQQGFDVTAIDVAPTAIEQAYANAQALQQNATFVCDDFLTTTELQPSYDLIVDSSFLHCLVYDEDRAGAFGRVRDLKPKTLILHTMVSDRAFDFGPKFEFDLQGFLYYRGAEGRSPQRRILPKEKIVQELTQRGFHLKHSELLYEDQAHTPLTLFAVFASDAPHP